jgi:hypothetical protein
MKPSSTSDPVDRGEAKLPRQDWILLPAIGLLTIFLLAVSAESTARWLFPVSAIGLESCFRADDPTGDAPVRPNSACSEQIAESKYVAEYKFNSSGFRADLEPGSKQPGAYRIVMMGSSFAMGLFVPREKTFAALLPAELSRQTGRKIELYNESTGGKFRGGPFPVPSSALHFKEVLSAAPDMILWIVTPNDLENAASATSGPAPRDAVQNNPASSRPPNPPSNVWNSLRIAIANGTVGDKLRGRWEQSRISLVLKHLLLASESQNQYVESYLKNETDSGFLKTEPSLEWQALLRNFQADAADFESQAKAAGVPFVAVLVPNRAQAAMAAMDEWPAGYDPYKLDDELSTIVVSYGGTYIDILRDFRRFPNPEQHYFPVDGHPDADGHALISQLLARQLTSGVVPALKAHPQSHVALEQAR